MQHSNVYYSCVSPNRNQDDSCSQKLDYCWIFVVIFMLTGFITADQVFKKNLSSAILICLNTQSW